jgi:S-adenosyl-L-methionine hydrolase (adenosine-forming)
MARPLITFTSDFGHDDWFVGVVHGVVHEVCPEARVVDLCHTIEPGDVLKAAFVLEAASEDFGPGAVHLAVVDPGVGTTRRALAVAARGQFFVGPDNGILDTALADPSAVAHALIEKRWFREPVSRTFHGRDVFAPVAGHLANGVKVSDLGPRVTDPVRLGRPVARRDDGALAGRIAHIDRFGNALTNLLAEAITAAFPRVPESSLVVEIGGLRIRGISRSYGDAPLGTVVAILGSSQRLEVAQVGGHASLRYGLGLGDPVIVRTLDSSTPLAPA